MRRRPHRRGRDRAVAARVLALLPFYGRARGHRPRVVAVDLRRRLRPRPVRAGVLPAAGRARRRGASRRDDRSRARLPQKGSSSTSSSCRGPVRQRHRLVLLGQPHLGVRAAAVVERDDPAVVVGVAVGAHPEHSASAPAIGTKKPQVEQGAGADRQRRAGPASPSYQRCAARSRPSGDSTRARPRPRSLGDHADRALSSVSSGSSPKRVRRHQPRVVVVDGQQVAWRKVAGLDPLAVGHPRRRDDGLVAGDQHDLVDGDRFCRDARATVTDQCQPTYPAEGTRTGG